MTSTAASSTAAPTGPLPAPAANSCHALERSVVPHDCSGTAHPERRAALVSSPTPTAAAIPIATALAIVATARPRSTRRHFLRYGHDHGPTAGPEDLTIGRHDHLQFAGLDPEKLRGLAGRLVDVVRDELIGLLALIVHIGLSF